MDSAAGSDPHQQGKLIQKIMSLNFIKTTVCPRRMSVAPPNFHNEVGFTKGVDYNKEFEVNDSALVSPRVLTSKGFVMWHVLRGVNSIYRMGFIPQGSVAIPVSVPAINPGEFSINDVCNLTAAGTGNFLSQVILDAELAVPYGISQQIQIAPELQDNFSKTRMFAGIVDVVCNTISAGTITLNGTIAGGAISDTRDICQHLAGGIVNAFSVSDLVQTSITLKDGEKEVLAQDGVIALVGPDIAPNYTTPEAEDDDVIDAGFFHYRSVIINTTVTGYEPSGDPGLVTNQNGRQMASIWVSPWRTTASAVSIPGSIGMVNLTATNNQVSPIDEHGVFDFRVTCTVYPPAHNTAGGSYFLWGFWIHFTHFFLSCLENGSVASTKVEDSQLLWCGGDTDPGDDLTPMRLSTSSEPKINQDGFATSGKYFGTLISFEYRTCDLQQGVALPAPPADPLTVDLRVTDVDIGLRARTINARGAVGPVRIIRWDNMSDTQRIKCDGRVLVQAVPTSDIAPFVQSSRMTADEAVNINVMTLLSELYNGPMSEFRRIYTGHAYRMVKDMVFPRMDTANLAVASNKDDPKAGAHMEAAGMFSDAFGQLGGMAGRAFLGPHVGEGLAGMIGTQLGSIAGSAVDGMFGAGEFGAAGQFAAAGQFGAVNPYNHGGITEGLGAMDSGTGNVPPLNSAYASGARRSRTA